MKHFSKIFDLFLYQSIFVPIFGSLLYLLNDPISFILFAIAIFSGAVTAVMGITGLLFNLFVKEPEEF